MPRKQNESQSRLGQFTIMYRSKWQARTYTQGLTWDDKAMLAQLQTFDGISAAGVIRAEAPILAQKHPDRSGEQIDGYLASLEAKGYIARSGSETFLRDWFINQPVQLRAPKNVTSMLTAIRRVGYDDLRQVVTEALFEALLEIATVDGKPTSVEVRRLCAAIAEEQGYALPRKLSPKG